MAVDPSCREYEGDLTAFFQGELPEERRAEIERHLADCPACAAGLTEIESVFGMAGKVEDLAPSMRMKRNLEALIRESSRLVVVGKEGFLFRLRAAAAFLGHRFRTSPRFRAASIAVAVHVVLLLVISLVVVPGIAERGPRSVRIEWPMEGTADTGPAGSDRGSEVARNETPAPPSPVPDDGALPAVSPPPVLDPFVDAGMFPPAERMDYAEMTGIFATSIESYVKELRMAAFLGEGKGALGSVERGLKWLAAEQRADGSWAGSTVGPADAYRTGVTATALLAFLSDGHSMTRGKKEWREVVRKGVRHLLDEQRGDDDELPGLIGPDRWHYTYNHALACLALVETWTLDGRRLPKAEAKRLKAGVQSALRFIRACQGGDGAWRYRLEGPEAGVSNTSVSLFQVLALASARSARFPVPATAFSGFASWLRSVTDEDGVVGYERVGDRDRQPRTMTAGALLLEELLGLAAPLRDRQAALVKGGLANSDVDRNALLRFYATLALRLRGERPGPDMAPALLAEQGEDGSWDATGDLHAIHGGDAFLTALNILTLTAAYGWSGA